LELDTLRHHLLGKKGAREDFPFGPETLVLKVMGKVFALIGLEDQPLHITLKCDPDLALFLRDAYPAVRPGYHTNKTHWNTITLDGSLPEEEIFKMIDESYGLVVKGLTRADRARLAD